MTAACLVMTALTVDCVIWRRMDVTVLMAGRESFVIRPVLRAHSAGTAPSPVNVRMGPSVIQRVESADAHQGSVEICARMAVLRAFTANTAIRNVTVPTMDAAIAHMEPVCVIQASMGGFATSHVPDGPMDLAVHLNVSVYSRTLWNATDVMEIVCVNLAIRAKHAVKSVAVVTMARDARKNASVHQECPAIMCPDSVSAQLGGMERAATKNVRRGSLDLAAPNPVTVMEQCVIQ